MPDTGPGRATYADVIAPGVHDEGHREGGPQIHTETSCTRPAPFYTPCAKADQTGDFTR
jgi:hypothetical protein